MDGLRYLMPTDTLALNKLLLIIYFPAYYGNAMFLLLLSGKNTLQLAEEPFLISIWY